MSVETYIYDKRFFDNTLALEGPSARAAAWVLIRHFQPSSVIDIGCGNGVYLREFKNCGVKIAGYDGAPAAIEHSLVGKKIKLHDLCEPLKLTKTFDLCLCFEVAEHLSASAADTLIQSLTRLADTIVFTAATPGQGPRSIGHINEQPRGYWIEKFQDRGFRLRTKLTATIRQEMAARDVVWWIVKNLMVFQKGGVSRIKI